MLGVLPAIFFATRTNAAVVAVATSVSLAVMVSMTLITFAWSPKAEACRDCPFPMKTSENHWLMPNGQIEVTIYQHMRRNGKIETNIELHSQATGELLASGTVLTPKGQSNVTTQLLDPKGNQVSLEIAWTGDDHEHLQIGMHCLSNSCSIDSFMN